jgi:hypothetical protein
VLPANGHLVARLCLAERERDLFLGVDFFIGRILLPVKVSGFAGDLWF